eukprot:15478259-Alexandrium_andersonii.AAC.1
MVGVTTRHDDAGDHSDVGRGNKHEEEEEEAHTWAGRQERTAHNHQQSEPWRRHKHTRRCEP